jgi:hypothetical protein
MEVHDAKQKVLAELQVAISLDQGDEFIISLESESQDEWVFRWDTKSWVETQNPSTLHIGSHLVAVK